MRVCVCVCVCVCVQPCDPRENFFPRFYVHMFTSRGHGGLSLAMPTKLWELTGRETGRSFLYLQQKRSAWALDSAACGRTFAVGFTCQADMSPVQVHVTVHVRTCHQCN